VTLKNSYRNNIDSHNIIYIFCQVNFTLRFEEIPYLRKFCEKADDEETFRITDNERVYLRSQFRRTPVWDTVIRVLFYKNDDGDMPVKGNVCRYVLIVCLYNE